MGGKGGVFWKLTLREWEAEVLKAPRALRAEDKVWLGSPRPGRAQAVGRLAAFLPQPSFPHRELASDQQPELCRGEGLGWTPSLPETGQRHPQPSGPEGARRGLEEAPQDQSSI